MTETQTAAVILAAGLGTRMKSRTPKVLHPLSGRPMIHYLLETVEAAGLDPAVVVVGRGMEAVADAVKPHASVVQDPPLGTAHAVLAAKDALRGFTGDILVLFGADPLLGADTIRRMLDARRREPGPAVVVLGFRTQAPGAYGRLIQSADGSLEAIREAGDASAQERDIELCNSGVMLLDGGRAWGLLERIGKDNAKGEYYLTDVVGLARADGLHCALVEGDEEELIGIDSRADLARAEAALQSRLRAAAMAGGATLLDPKSVYFSFDTKLGQDVTVGPGVQFGPGVTVGDGTEIRAYCHIEGATIAAGARIGPFARLRPGTDIAKDARIGNFVEVKNAVVEAGAKANHLAYVGDARVGAGANVGAGTITCNYDGAQKHHTDIGAGAFIGSNVALVAPVRVGDGALVGAGSVVTRDVAKDALAVARAKQAETPGGAKRVGKGKARATKPRRAKAKT